MEAMICKSPYCKCDMCGMPIEYNENYFVYYGKIDSHAWSINQNNFCLKCYLKWKDYYSD